jgi:ABC-2 type transport system ATP-binding protein
MSLVDVRQLNYRFKGESDYALKDLSLNVQSGEILGLIGPDGAGKTTLLRLLSGVLKAESGSISVLNGDPLKNHAQLSHHIGYMTQRFSLYEDLTISDNISLYANLHGISKEEANIQGNELLKSAGLFGFQDRLAGKLSGGMKQKLALICAMLGSPELMFLDEPGVGVDPLSRRELWKLVEDASKLKNRGIIWATAYLEEAARCHRVCILHEGRVRYLGTPDGILRDLQDRVFSLPTPVSKRMQTLRCLQANPNISDAMIKGSDIRFMLRSDSDGFVLPDGAVSVKPNFEEAFINLLGLQLKTKPFIPTSEPIDRENPVVIKTEGLTKQFGNFVATDHLNIAVHRGEIFGLLGANGAGKTTAFRMMCGLLSPTEGKADIMGIDLKRDARRARSHIGYMAQKFSLYSNLTVKQNLNFFASIYGLKGDERKNHLNESIEKYDLERWMHHRSGTLPLGVKQRLSMACATLHHPEFLFLDEPTSGVDPFARREFWEEINDMALRGVTIIVTTHFMDEAQYLHRMVIMDRGRVIAEGSPEELKRQASTSSLPNPDMEEAFIHFISRQEER